MNRTLIYTAASGNFFELDEVRKHGDSFERSGHRLPGKGDDSLTSPNHRKSLEYAKFFYPDSGKNSTWTRLQSAKRTLAYCRFVRSHSRKRRALGRDPRQAFQRSDARLFPLNPNTRQGAGAMRAHHSKAARGARKSRFDSRRQAAADAPALTRCLSPMGRRSPKRRTSRRSRRARRARRPRVIPLTRRRRARRALRRVYGRASTRLYGASSRRPIGLLPAATRRSTRAADGSFRRPKPNPTT